MYSLALIIIFSLLPAGTNRLEIFDRMASGGNSTTDSSVSFRLTANSYHETAIHKPSFYKSSPIDLHPDRFQRISINLIVGKWK